MQKTNFLKNDVLYFVEHNNLPGVGKVETRNDDVLLIETGGRVYHIDETYNMTETSTSVTYDKPEWDSTFTIRFLELDDASKIFPDSIKTFNDIDSLTLAAQDSLMASGLEAPKELTDTYSFSVDEENNVLELIQTSVDGDISYRNNNNWVKLNPDDDAPTIFNQKLIDVDPNDLDSAIKVWDLSESGGNDLTLEDIKPFASVDQ